MSKIRDGTSTSIIRKEKKWNEYGKGQLYKLCFYQRWEKIKKNIMLNKRNICRSTFISQTKQKLEVNSRSWKIEKKDNVTIMNGRIRFH